MCFKVRELALGSVILLMVPSAVGQSTRIEQSLDGPWQFHFVQTIGAMSSGPDDSQFESITVPHSWPKEGQNLPSGGFRAKAIYRRTFEASSTWSHKRVILHFEAVSLDADVILNGKHIGEHKGGFAAFNFDITETIRFDATNVLEVHVSNEADPDLSPLAGDFTIYGGIYRHVSLLLLDPVHITPLDYASPGVFLQTRSVSPERAVVEVRTEIANQSKAVTRLTVKTTIRDKADHAIAAARDGATAKIAETTAHLQTISIKNPHLWNGVADPYLYSVQVDLMRNGRVVDRVVQPLGIRTERVDPIRGFILNGNAMQIHGVCLHQEGATAGWAVSADDERRDMEIIREMGANGIRLAHYQHSQSFLDMADRTGMLIWAELAQVDRVSPSPAYRNNIRQQLTELIRQNYNHPSIFVWSLYNELNSPTKQYSIPLVAELNRLAHSEDATRPTSGAGSADTMEHLHEMAVGVDLISVNDYPGWYFGAPEDMGARIDKWNVAYGSRGIGVTEYGAGASVHQHKADVTKQDVQVRGHLHPEEWQAIVHEANYAAIRQRPFVWGSFVWNMFDFSSFGRHEGDTDGVNDKGLVTRDRMTRKDAYFFYQANWTEKPMVHVVECQNPLPVPTNLDIKAYSNQTALKLSVNGSDVGRIEDSSNHVFVWKDVRLKAGENKVVVSSPRGFEARCVLNGGKA